MHTPNRWATLLLFVFALAIPTTAAADITAFLGVNPTPTNRTTKGFAIGTGLLVVGVEFEYARASEDISEGSPSLRTFMFNGLVQTPVPIAGMQFYGTAGGGIYRETLDDDSETNVGVNVGGGVKMKLAGPIRLRLDYRIATLRGDALYPRPQRFYAGINIKF